MASEFERVRSRTFPPKRKGVLTLGKIYPWNTNTKNWSVSSNQTHTFNFNLPFWKAETIGDETHKGPPYLEGGPMKSLSAERVFPYEMQGVGTYLQRTDVNPSNWQKYVGGFAPPSETDFGGEIDMSNANTLLNLGSSLFPVLDAYGTQAWSRTKPHLEHANAFVFIAELRDLPRMAKSLQKRAFEFHKIWSQFKRGSAEGALEFMSPKSRADDFLEHQFGWQPFLSDLRKFYSTYHGSAEYIKQLTAENGKAVRRKSTLIGVPIQEAGPDGKPRIRYGPSREDTLVSKTTGQILTPSLPASFFSTPPSWEVRKVVETKLTAVGRFTFYRPEFDTGLSEYNSAWFEIQRQLTLYGLRISPSNIWRATPWTWLIDWFSTVSSYFDYLTDIAVDSITAKYLYLTMHRDTIWKLNVTLPFYDPGSLYLSWERKLHTLERKGASSPYGFSLSWDSLNPRQLAILGALGITRRKPSGGIA